MADPRLENDSVATNPPLNTEHEVTGDVAEVNVFFDGTLNNYYNVEASVDVKAKHKRSDSYINEKSNVARLWEAIKNNDSVNPVYVEGMGTSYDPDAKGDDRYKNDSTTGYAVGQGETGVEVRAKDAFRRIMEKVNETRGGKLPLHLEINVFGFSRGAATARHFVHLLNTERKKYFTDPEWKNMVQYINFVGLFDTVSSFGYDLNFSDDAKQLHLDFGNNYATKVFHLCAGDEYRKNFALTSIQSAIKQSITVNGKTRSIGYELTIPGAHSDVGGGYHDIEPESRSFEQQHKAIVKFIEQQGWYSPDQCQGMVYYLDNGDSGYEPCTYYSMDREIKSDYYKIALTLMVEKVEAHDRGNVPEFSPTIGILSSGDKKIEDLRGILRQIAKREQEIAWGLTEQLGEEKAREFRREYLHMSFNEQRTGMGITSKFRRTVHQG